MKKCLIFIVIIFSILMLSAITLAKQPPSQKNDARQQMLYGKLPLSFIENKGQLDKQVRYVIRGPQASAFFTNNGVTFDLTQSQTGKPKSPRDSDHVMDVKPTTIKHVALKMEFRDASPKCVVTGMDKLPGKVNMFIGKDSTKWKKGIGTYKGVIYKNVWKGIDVAYRGDKRELKYDILVSPGARVSQIKLRYSGAEKLSLDRKGDLHIQTAVASFIETVPGVHQMKSGKKIVLKGAYTLIDKQTVGFKVQDVDPTLLLVIDPVSDLKYSTYLGGTRDESNTVIAADSQGCAYIGGETRSLDFPTTPGAYDVTYNGNPSFPYGNVYISKLNPQGTSLEYSTYFGGNKETGLGDIAVDDYGYLYITGWANMTGFPSTPGAISISDQDTHGMFIGKLCPSGDAFEYLASFGGAASSGSPSGIAIDSQGCAYITGTTSSTNFLTTEGAYQRVYGGSNDCFITKINPTGTMLDYSTYLGGSGDEGFRSKIQVDDDGCAYVSSSTSSADFPTTSGVYDRTCIGNQYDVFVTKLNSTGTALAYSTFLGGSQRDTAGDLALDSEKNVYVAGWTESADFPTMPGVYHEHLTYAYDAFITKLNSSGSSLLFSTYLGGGYPLAISRDSEGYIYIAGVSFYSATPDAFRRENSITVGDEIIHFPCFIAKFDQNCTNLVYSTNFGGSNLIGVDDMAVDNEDAVYITGRICTDGLSVTPGAFDTTFNGGTSSDAFVAKFDIKHASVKPDVWFRPLTVSSYTGMNVYEDSPSTQVCNQSVKVSKTAVYYAWIENDSSIPGYIAVKGTALPAGWSLKYTDADGVDITSYVLSGLYITQELRPGRKQLIIIYVKPLPGTMSNASIALTASSVGTSSIKDSAKFNAVFDPAKPDIWLRPSTNNTYIGMNVYESTPDTQVCSQPATNRTLVYYARIENDGGVSGKFIVKGDNAPAGWTLKYLDASNVDVTSAVIAGTYETTNLAPGTNHLITVQLKPSLNAPIGNVSVNLTATNAVEGSSDSVRFVARYGFTKPDMWIRALPDSSYTGMNVYEDTPVVQVCSQTASTGKTLVYYCRIENDGEVFGKFSVKGDGAPVGWSVKYLDANSVDITSAVVAGTYTTIDLDTGSNQLLVVYLKPLPNALAGNVSVKLMATGQGESKGSDSGRFEAQKP